MSTKTIVCAIAALVFIMISPTDAFVAPPPNCTTFRWMLSGVEALSVYSSNLYNHPQALETNNSFHGYAGIASNLFEGLQIMGMAGLYVQLLDNIKDDPAIANYSGFGNLDIPGFFSGMLRTLTKDTCEWLLSYPNDALTLRPNINCSHPAEQIMLSAWTLFAPALHDFEFDLGTDLLGHCGNQRLHRNIWLKKYILDDFTPEINYLHSVVTNAKK